mgnify:CR=1 FL=1
MSSTNGTITNLNVTGISTLGTVKISSGIITATSGIVTYFGDGNFLNLTSNPSRGIGIGTIGGVVGYAVTFIDFKGAGVSTTPAISLPQLTAVSAATFSDSFSSGKKTYKFTVGSTEGSFSGVVDLPTYNGTTYSQVAQTVSYKVASTSTAVSNADVLKAIVSLIASINKQIAALQKALLKK